MRAYVTLLSTINYLLGVIVLGESLRQVGATYPLWVALSESIPPNIDALLRHKGMHVIRLPASIEIPSQLKEKSGYWGNTFDKLHLFGLTKFDKLVYLDSDMMVLLNIDELFEKPHMSAVAAGRLVHPGWERLNSGLMVIEPAAQLPEKIAATLQEMLHEIDVMANNTIGDQDLINAYYPEWPDSQVLHLDQGYNVFYSDMDVYVNQHGYSLPGMSGKEIRPVRVVHFVGRHKPWMKWAGLRHFSNTFDKRLSTKWERSTFLMYRRLLKKIQPLQGF